MGFSVDDKGVNPFSTDDDEEEDEEDEGDDEEKKGNLNVTASKKFKNLNSNDWRKLRHEREEFFSRKVIFWGMKIWAFFERFCF